MILAISLLVLVSYLLGSIPVGYLLVRLFRNQDIRSVGSGNIGATNVLRSGGKGLGAATFALDVVKGAAAVALRRKRHYADYVHAALACRCGGAYARYPLALRPPTGGYRLSR